MRKVLSLHLVFLMVVSFLVCLAPAQKASAAGGTTAIKVACIGDSITAGAGLSSPNTQSYPARLQEFLGSNYIVGNYGVSGSTLLKNGDKPYWKQAAFRQSSNWNPDIVIIQLGTNDAKAWNWNLSGTNASTFISDYKELINHYRSLPSNPKVYVNLPPHVFEPGAFSIDPSILQNQVVPAVLEAATTISPAAYIIDVNSATLNTPEYFQDTVHPNVTGAAYIAEVVAYSLGYTKPIPAGMLDRTGWTATASNTDGSETPDKVFDKYASTRWSTGVAQSNGMWFTVDMKSTKTFSKIELDQKYSDTDFPNGYQVFVSNDGTSWGSAIATGTGATTLTTITFPTQTARYIKIVQTGSAAQWWSIHDFRVY